MDDNDKRELINRVSRRIRTQLGTNSPASLRRIVSDALLPELEAIAVKQAPAKPTPSA